jgi:hypothetical protein
LLAWAFLNHHLYLDSRSETSGAYTQTLSK